MAVLLVSGTSLFALVGHGGQPTLTPMDGNAGLRALFTPATVSLSPNVGPVGTGVLASGNGYAPSSPISFSFAGSPVSTTCSSDPTGAFPGSSGTPCSFTVQSVPGGNETLMVSDLPASSLQKTVPAGPSPAGLAWDSGKGEVFVANYGANTVTAFNDSTYAVVATIPVGAWPVGVAYDSAMGEVFVTNSVANTVSVINDTTNTVTATIIVGGMPWGIAYDPVSGGLFVADLNANSVTIISGTTNTPIAVVPVPGSGGTWDVAYDPTMGEVFVSESNGATISAINDTTNAVVATIPVGGGPRGLAYDPAHGDVLVGCLGSNQFEAVSDVSNTVVGIIPLPSPYAIAYDPNTGEAFVTTSTQLVVIGLPGLQIINAMTTGTPWAPGGVTYDPNPNYVFVSNYGSNTVDAFPAGRIVTTTFTVTSSLTLSIYSGPVGTQVSASGNGFAASQSVSLSFGGKGVVWTCNTDPTGTFPGTSGTSCSFAVPATPHGSATVGTTTGTLTASANFSITSSLSLQPTRGHVGISVTATGTGFAANAPVQFTVRGTAVTSACSTDSTGSFPGTSGTSCTFTFPAEPVGGSTVTATDSQYNSASTTFTVSPALSLSPTSGPTGLSVTATGTGFAVSSQITLTFGQTVVSTSCSADSHGSFPVSPPCTFTVPPSSLGAVTVTAKDASSNSATVTFTVTSNLTLTPTSGTVGSTVSAQGWGFTASSTISLTFGGNSVTSNCAADSNGVFPGSSGTPCAFSVPASPYGATTVTATDGQGKTANAVFDVLPNLRLSPTTGPVGLTVSGTGSGFLANSTISFKFGGQSVSSTCSTDSTGTFPGTSGTACTFTVPSIAVGPVLVTATGNGGVTGTANFVVTYSLILSPSSGPDGIVVSASNATGVTLPASSQVRFTFGGTPITSVCWTDASGAFPGISGTPCTFVVPMGTSAGSYTVVAGVGAVNVSAPFDVVPIHIIKTINPVDTTEFGGSVFNLGLSPHGVVFASGGGGGGMGYVFFVNSGSNSVDVWEPEYPGNWKATPVCTYAYYVSTGCHDIPVGSGSPPPNPQGDCYDAETNDVFVVDEGSNDVTVIDATSLQVVALVPLGPYSEPTECAYDPTDHQIFVSSPQGVFWMSDTLLIPTLIPTGGGTTGLDYDARLGEVFAADPTQNVLNVINAPRDTYLTNAPLLPSSSPQGVTYDPATSNLWVTFPRSGQVAILNDSTYVPLGPVGVGGSPEWATYDTLEHEVFVTNGNGYLDVFNDTTFALVYSPQVIGNSFSGITYDPAMNEIWIADNGGSSGSEYSDSASNPFSPAYDSANGEVYVPNSVYGDADIISDSTNRVVNLVSNLKYQGPTCAVYDSGRGEIFFTEQNKSYVQVVSDTSNSVVASIKLATNSTKYPYPFSAAYDSGKGEVFVTLQGNNSVAILSDLTNTVASWLSLGSGYLPLWVTYDPAHGEFLVLANSTTLGGVINVYNDTNNSLVSQIVLGPTFGVANFQIAIGGEGFALVPSANEIYVANANGNDVMVVSTTTNSVVGTISVGNYPSSVAYDPSIRVVFVVNGLGGSVSVISVGTGQVIATLPTGVFPMSIAYDAGMSEMFVPDESMGYVSILSG